MQFSVIIPTCSRNDMLALCLEKVAPGKQTLSHNLYEVIVTDDGKNNEAKELIDTKYVWAKWVAGPKKGPAANRNNGAKSAKGDWLVFTDDDCLPDKNWLQEFLHAIHEIPSVKAFEGAILPDDWKLLRKDLAECPVNDKGGCFWSANIMVEKQLFDNLGGFDEQFKIAAQEDQDLKRRIEILQQIGFVQTAAVIHPVRQGSLKKKLKNLEDSLSNWYQYHQKHFNHNKSRLLREEALKHLKLSIIFCWKGHFSSAIYHVASASKFMFKQSIFR